jgi:Tfp pilus assembly protein PilX
MAGNSRDHNLAFQAAEATLNKGETLLEILSSASDFGAELESDGLPPQYTPGTGSKILQIRDVPTLAPRLWAPVVTATDPRLTTR